MNTGNYMVEIFIRGNFIPASITNDKFEPCMNQYYVFQGLCIRTQKDTPFLGDTYDIWIGLDR